MKSYDYLNASEIAWKDRNKILQYQITTKLSKVQIVLLNP